MHLVTLIVTGSLIRRILATPAKIVGSSVNGWVARYNWNGLMLPNQKQNFRTSYQFALATSWASEPEVPHTFSSEVLCI